ncbi:MAG TPA: hypothetical protein VL943_10690, partial [Niabella sp.]|nr:hypothetical protein [Niabella sp.]
MKTLLIFLFLFMSRFLAFAQTNDHYETSVTFPANYQVGDYTEFVKMQPLEVGASGYYEVSISYTRGNIAAAATHIVSVSHANPNLWREAGRVNANNYTTANIYNFTIDCNT